MPKRRKRPRPAPPTSVGVPYRSTYDIVSGRIVDYYDAGRTVSYEYDEADGGASERTRSVSSDDEQEDAP
jgi:hypothetical protein